MTNPSDLTRLVPGFEFLQNLMKGAGAGIPGMSQWIAPTINPEELEKRISELKTVQFWLENNARLLATTIQALEVQRMTLSTLQTMNLPLADLRDALKINLPKPAPGRPAAQAEEQEEEEQEEQEEGNEAEDTPAKSLMGKKAASGKAGTAGAKAASAIDPMQWWGALTQQFTELATNALKDGVAETARSMPGAAVKQAASSARAAVKKVATRAGQGAAGTARRGSAPAAKKRSR